MKSLHLIAKISIFLLVFSFMFAKNCYTQNSEYYGAVIKNDSCVVSVTCNRHFKKWTIVISKNGFLFK